MTFFLGNCSRELFEQSRRQWLCDLTLGLPLLDHAEPTALQLQQVEAQMDLHWRARAELLPNSSTSPHGQLSFARFCFTCQYPALWRRSLRQSLSHIPNSCKSARSITSFAIPSLNLIQFAAYRHVRPFAPRWPTRRTRLVRPRSFGLLDRLFQSALEHALARHSISNGKRVSVVDPRITHASMHPSPGD